MRNSGIVLNTLYVYSYVLISSIILQADDVTILSLNEDSNSSNLCDVNLHNGTTNHSQEHTERNKPVVEKPITQKEHTPSTSKSIVCT